MSLLSKTLQTFLSKYLSDVDVQGVALPTLSGDGWGVQLSNVQLRNGVELLSQMPGKVKRKKSSTKKKQKHNTKTNEKEEAEQETRRRQKHPTTSQGGRPNHESEDKEDPLGEERMATTNTAAAARGQASSLSSRCRTHSLEELDVSIRQLRNDTNEAATPAQPSSSKDDTTTTSSTIFSCFTKGRNNKLSSSVEDEDTLPYYTEEQEGGNETPLIRTTQESSNGLAMDGDYPLEENEESSYTVGRQNTTVTEQDSEKEGDIEKKDGSDDDDDDYECEDEEEETYEQAYRLCVGDNGRIGTLDIRYVPQLLLLFVDMDSLSRSRN